MNTLKIKEGLRSIKLVSGFALFHPEVNGMETENYKDTYGGKDAGKNELSIIVGGIVCRRLNSFTRNC